MRWFSRAVCSYEMDGVDEQLAREAFALAAAKLPVKTTFVVRQIGM